MKIKTQFVSPVSKEKMLHNLRNVKKIIPSLRQYLFEVTEEKYLMKNDEGKVVAEFRYLIEVETHVIHFDKFKGEKQEEIKKMLIFSFPEEVGEKCYVDNLEKNWKAFFDFSEWFLMEEDKTWKIGRDREKLIEVELYHIPREARVGVGN